MAYKIVFNKRMNFWAVLLLICLLVLSSQFMLANSGFAADKKDLYIGSTQLKGQGVVLGIYDGGVNLANSALKTGSTSRIVSQNCVGSFTEINPCSNDDSTKAQNICYTTDIGCFHGMAVASFAAGNNEEVNIQNKKYEIGGPASQAKIAYVRQAMDKKGTIKYEDFISALNIFVDDVQTHKSYAPSVINLSLSFPRDSYSDCNQDNEAKRAIDYLTSQGVIVVASSGNESDKSRISYPACMDNVIAVGSSKDQNGNQIVSDFSNMSNDIDIVAPGENIVAVAPEERKYLKVEGTSFAAPIVSGAIVLMKQIDPTINTSRAIEVLHQSGSDITDLQTGNKYKELNIDKALISLGAIPELKLNQSKSSDTKSVNRESTEVNASSKVSANESASRLAIDNQNESKSIKVKTSNYLPDKVMVFIFLLAIVLFLLVCVYIRSRRVKSYFPTKWDDIEFESEILALEYKYLESLRD
ncbi:MAG: S8/S53 family peptidase [Acidimicrobiia bacterium]